MSDMNRIEQLTQALRDLDSDCFAVEEGELLGLLTKQMGTAKKTTVALGSDPLLEEIGLADQLEKKGYKVIRPIEPVANEQAVLAWRDSVAKAQVGITSARTISAETGSALLPGGYPDVRIVSLLPEHHVIIIRERKVVRDIRTVFKEWGDRGETRQSAVVVTGPSRTADIEKELVVGVHGPIRVSVFVLKSASQETDSK